MLLPKTFFQAQHDLFLKKRATICINLFEIQIDSVGQAHKFKTFVMPLKDLWDTKALQTLRSNGYIDLGGNSFLIENGGNLYFEQLVNDSFSYSSTRKSIPNFCHELAEIKVVFGYPSF
jgi:hypothetical protein